MSLEGMDKQWRRRLDKRGSWPFHVDSMGEATLAVREQLQVDPRVDQQLLEGMLGSPGSVALGLVTRGLGMIVREAALRIHLQRDYEMMYQISK